MKNKLQLFFLLLISTVSWSQERSRFSIEANYGLNGNFFVRGYNESSLLNEALFYRKNFIGSAGGLELKYEIGKTGRIGLAYTRTINKGVKNYTANINGVDIRIEDFNIRHTNEFYQAFIEVDLVKKKFLLSYQAGVYLIYSNLQELLVGGGDIINIPVVIVRERNLKNSHLQEAGVLLGLHYSIPIDTKFFIGLKTRVYYTASIRLLELISLTPTLIYKF